jgi:hypothetical protein
MIPKAGEGRSMEGQARIERPEPRTYRERVAADPEFRSFTVCVRETDLFIRCDRDLGETALKAVHRYRSLIENYIRVVPEFLHTHAPLPDDPLAPGIVRAMLASARAAGVGPMAAVAGAIAEYVGRALRQSPGISNVIVENGGDIYLNCEKIVFVNLLAGESRLSGRMSLVVRPDRMPVGVCTSSGTVGHSFSYGLADAVCVVAASATLADAAATSIANGIRSKRDIESGDHPGRYVRDRGSDRTKRDVS